MNDQPGLRERKKRATREALRLAALRLAVEQGWERVRVEDIAAEAGVSTRTFNNYFAGKDEAFLATAYDRGARGAAAARGRGESREQSGAVGSSRRTIQSGYQKNDTNLSAVGLY